MSKGDWGNLAIIILVIWFVASIFGSLIFLSNSIQSPATLHSVRSYFGDAGNTTYTITKVTPSDGAPSFNVTLSCNYYQDGQTIIVDHTSNQGPWILWPILRGPPGPYQGWIPILQKGC